MEREQSTEWTGIWEVLGCKWTFHVIRLLGGGSRRFNEIKGAIDGLPASTLSTRLKQLQNQEIVSRSVEDTTPPTASYALTSKGEAVADVVRQLEAIERNW